MIIEQNVADVCPACGGKRDARVVFATRHRTVRVPDTCPRRAQCESDVLKLATEGA